MVATLEKTLKITTTTNFVSLSLIHVKPEMERLLMFTSKEEKASLNLAGNFKCVGQKIKSQSCTYVGFSNTLLACGFVGLGKTIFAQPDLH